MKKMDNKRENIRKRCFVPIDGKKDSLYDNLFTIDIGEGGIGFISSKLIPVDEKIVMEIDYGIDREPVLVEGQVKWIRKMEDCNNYRLGLKFNKIC